MDFQHVKPGKGGAFVRTKLKRVEDGNVVDKTFRAGEKFRPVRTETKRMQYLYDSGDAAVFMDSETYDQLELPKDSIADEMRWVLPNDTIELLLVDERPSGVQVDSAVELAVTQTDPGLKGDTASGGGSKPATLETGVVVQVPLFVNEGDRVRVDTRSRRVRLARLSRAPPRHLRVVPRARWRQPLVAVPGERRLSFRSGRRADARCDRRLVAALAAEQWGVLTSEELRACGLSARAVIESRRPRMPAPPHRGVFAVGHAEPAVRGADARGGQGLRDGRCPQPPVGGRAVGLPRRRRTAIRR